MKKELLASIIFAASCFLFFILVVPEYGSVLDVRAAIKSQEALLKEREVLRKNFEEVIKKYQERKTDFDRLAALVPENPQLDQLISAMDKTATQNGLQLKTLEAGIDTSNIAVPRTVFTKIELSGTYQSFLGFIKEVEKSLRLFDIAEIAVGRDTSGTADKFTIEVKMSAYTLK